MTIKQEKWGKVAENTRKVSMHFHFVKARIFLYLGYYGVFSCSAGACLVGLVYLTVMVKEAKNHQESPETTPLRRETLSHKYF